ncbi:hypothetical protein PR048_019919 [Dryococelus australis]|uniref:Uncharacterized protein n=1 Tax=Dryococelus australis TaxID=614101 RepID=A0ABQ9H4V5_9NEOP|nr:hypothetical protein PR048_019919 [Dryococelus australis]
MTSPNQAIQFVPKMFDRVEVGTLGGSVQSANIVVGAKIGSGPPFGPENTKPYNCNVYLYPNTTLLVNHQDSEVSSDGSSRNGTYSRAQFPVVAAQNGDRTEGLLFTLSFLYDTVLQPLMLTFNDHVESRDDPRRYVWRHLEMEVMPSSAVKVYDTRWHLRRVGIFPSTLRSLLYSLIYDQKERKLFSQREAGESAPVAVKARVCVCVFYSRDVKDGSLDRDPVTSSGRPIFFFHLPPGFSHMRAGVATAAISPKLEQFAKHKQITSVPCRRSAFYPSPHLVEHAPLCTPLFEIGYDSMAVFLTGILFLCGKFCLTAMENNCQPLATSFLATLLLCTSRIKTSSTQGEENGILPRKPVYQKHNSQMQTSGSDPVGNRTRFALVEGEHTVSSTNRAVFSWLYCLFLDIMPLQAQHLATIQLSKARHLAIIQPPQARRLAAIQPPQAQRFAAIQPPQAWRLATIQPSHARRLAAIQLPQARRLAAIHRSTSGIRERQNQLITSNAKDECEAVIVDISDIFSFNNHLIVSKLVRVDIYPAVSKTFPEE